MAKRCPSCGYGPIGPFIDNCPICAEPVRNVRSSPTGSSGTSWWTTLPPVLKWVIGGAIIAVLGVVGCCGLGMWRLGTVVQDAEKAREQAQAQVEADRRARTMVVAAEGLLKEFQDDPAAADLKYTGKYLDVTGIVERVGPGRHGTVFVILHGGDETAKFKIECFFNYMAEAEGARIRRLGNGQTVTIRGEYDGRISNVQLRDCVLVK